jgi:hypothetical protein
MAYPIAARLADDPRMRPAFSAGEWVILDQSIELRREAAPDAFYLVKIGADGLIRRLRQLGNVLYLATDDALRNPLEWQRIDTTNATVPYFVRARAKFVTLASEWEQH